MIPSSLADVAAIALVATLAMLGAFQIALVAGAPFGEFAWGGKDRVLPANRRRASAVSVAAYALIAIVVLDRAGIIGLLPDLVSVIATWVVFGFLALSIVPNLLSKSRLERAAMIPASVTLAALSLLVALGTTNS